MYRSSGTTITYQEDTVQVFPFLPNYRRDFIERWEWKTNILQAYKGVEQRIALRTRPRRSFEYEVFARGNDRSALENYLWAGQARHFAVPCWNQRVTVTPATVPVGAYVPINPSNFVVGGYAVGFLSPTQHESHLITGISAQGITLDTSPNWQAWTTVCPLLLGNLGPTQAATRVTGDFSYAVMSFDMVPMYAPYEDVIPSYPSYKGFYVMEDTLDWSSGSDTSFEYATQTFDTQLASQLIVVTSETPQTIQKGKWFLKDKAHIDNFIHFCHAMQGRCQQFWMPTGTCDMYPLSVSRNLLAIQDSGYTRFLVDTSSRCYIRIQAKSGVVYYRKIVNAEMQSDTVEVLVLDTAVPLTAKDILMISFLNLARFDNDRVELAYKGPTFALSSNSIRTLNYVI